MSPEKSFTSCTVGWRSDASLETEEGPSSSCRAARGSPKGPQPPRLGPKVTHRSPFSRFQLLCGLSLLHSALMWAGFQRQNVLLPSPSCCVAPSPAPEQDRLTSATVVLGFCVTHAPFHPQFLRYVLLCCPLRVSGRQADISGTTGSSSARPPRPCA